MHTQEPCRLADWYAALHEPTCGRVAKSVRRHLAGQLGESHGAPEPLLDRGHRFAVELNEAGGDQLFALFSALCAQSSRGGIGAGVGRFLVARLPIGLR